ncbi:MAG: phosphoribosyltransferase family protein [Rikenellaceae bacterium]
MQKKSLISNIIELIIPKLCVACQSKLSEGERILCTSCRINIPYTYDWLESNNKTFELLNADYPIFWAASMCYYRKNDIFSRAILNMKFRNQSQSAKEFGAMFARVLKDKEISVKDVDIIIPLPLHPLKKLWRGYNQSELIADGMASIFGCDVEKKAVRRTVNNRAQSSIKNQKRRLKNSENIFRVAEGEKLDGKHILIVDDVITTGSTIHSLIKCITDSCDNCTISVATLARADRGKSKH